MTDAPLRIHRFDALRPGPSLVVLGGVHGDETCGSVAIGRTIAAIDAGEIAIARGTLTLVPVANPLARRLGRREGERNLNRMLRPTSVPRDHEDRVANRLCALLDEADALLDLHSFHTPGEPFAMIGPSDNDGPLEPFARAAEEEAFAARLGASRIVEGWLETYARGVARRRARARSVSPGAGADAHGTDGAGADPEYGVGTTEYARARGAIAVTLECGRHDDPRAPEVGWRAIRQALAWLRIAPLPVEPVDGPMQVLRLAEVVDRDHADDRLVREWTSFEAVRAGEPIAHRRDGAPVVAPADGRIVFPNPAAQPGREWFYFATPSARRL